MDSAVSLVQAYLRVNGYFTVTEYPVVEAMRGRRYQEATDLDVLAVRFPRASRTVPGESHADAQKRPPFEPDPILGAPGDRADMIIGEVKEGAAEFNPGAQRKDVFAAALARFGCCSLEESEKILEKLVRRGSAQTTDGHRIRLVAFGSKVGSEASTAFQQIPLGHVLDFLREYIRRHWAVLRHAHFKDPTFSLLVLEEKARLGNAGTTGSEGS